MTKKRVFFSFHLPPAIAEIILKAISQLNLPLALYPADNLHITLKFIGEVTETELAELATIMEALSARATGFPIFPKEFYVADERLRLNIELIGQLQTLHTELISRLQEKHIGKVDTRPYLPHVTLGRPTTAFNLEQLRYIDLSTQRFFMREVGLYESKPGENRMGNYTLLKSFPLKG